jgi:methylmalonyl-CoA mutase N-terminal domain/subunit
MNSNERTNRDVWEEAFGASRIREADYSTMSGVPLEAVYGPDDGEFPGQYPYTRGPHASMYRSKLWTMRMFAGFGTAEDTNWRFKEILKAGGTGCHSERLVVAVLLLTRSPTWKTFTRALTWETSPRR